MCSERPSKFRPDRALLHPLWWCALALLLVNDHFLKGAGALPAALTGKLSDVAGLIVAPVLLAAIVRARSRLALACCFGAVATVFAAINLAPAAATGLERLTAHLGFGWRVWCDPTDLLALPALALGWRLAAARRPPPELRLTRAVGERLATILGAVACMATSIAPPPQTVGVNGRVLSQSWGRGPLYVIEATTGLRLMRVDIDQFGSVATEIDGVLYLASSRGVRGVSTSVDRCDAQRGDQSWKRSGPHLRRWLARRSRGQRHARPRAADGPAPVALPG